MQSDDGLFINMFAGGEYKTTALVALKKLDIQTNSHLTENLHINIRYSLMQSCKTENLEVKQNSISEYHMHIISQ